MGMELDSPVDIFSASAENLLPQLRQMKNSVIGNNRQKQLVVDSGVVPRLVELVSNESTAIELKIESLVILGSLAKCMDSQLFIDAGALPMLFTGVSHSELKYIEACLRCLRSIVLNSNSSSVETVQEILFQEVALLSYIISILDKSSCTQECVMMLLAHCCTTKEHQIELYNKDIISAILPLLVVNNTRVQVAALRCLASLCYQNHDISDKVVQEVYNTIPLRLLLVQLMARDKPTDVQLSAAKCLTYLCRAKAVEANSEVISQKTLSTLVWLCKSDKSADVRVDGAITLAYLIENNVQLQNIAAISDHIIKTLAEYFRYSGTASDVTVLHRKKDDIAVGNELRQAAFCAYASLCANSEEVRKKLVDTNNIMEHLVNGLSDPVVKVHMAATRCLLSLSRSVQQLRTSFQDHPVWKSLLKMLQTSTDDTLLIMASSVVCNLMLDFSPSKQVFLDEGVIEQLILLTHHANPSLRLNGIWGLMNATFHCDRKVLDHVLAVLDNDELFRLVTDSCIDVLLKTLGLVRNLLSSRQQVDQVMCSHGAQMIQAVILTLEADYVIEVKEQALCVLINIAGGSTSKSYIMSNEDVLKKLIDYMGHSDVRLQIAATVCIVHLVCSDDEGAAERKAKLREIGVAKSLQKLCQSSNTTLLEKVKFALQQF